MTHTQRIAAVRAAADRIRAVADTTGVHQMRQLDEAIADNTKRHRRPSAYSDTPKKFRCNPAVERDFFLVTTIVHAFDTIGRRKTIPLQAIQVRLDYLIALAIVSRYGRIMKEKRSDNWLPKGIDLADCRRAIEAVEYSTDIAGR